MTWIFAGGQASWQAILISSSAQTIHPAPVVHDLELTVYPNPFNSTLNISLDVPLYADVSVVAV
jgi:hypothetical protein